MKSFRLKETLSFNAYSLKIPKEFVLNDQREWISFKTYSAYTRSVLKFSKTIKGEGYTVIRVKKLINCLHSELTIIYSLAFTSFLSLII